MRYRWNGVNDCGKGTLTLGPKNIIKAGEIVEMDEAQFAAFADKVKRGLSPADRPKPKVDKK